MAGELGREGVPGSRQRLGWAGSSGRPGAWRVAVRSLGSHTGCVSVRVPVCTHSLHDPRVRHPCRTGRDVQSQAGG